MKIGVIYTAYNCADYVDAGLKPWFSLKDKYDIVFSANSGMFKEYYDLGFPDRNQKTLEILVKYRPDFLVSTYGKSLLGEDDSRNQCLEFLKKTQCDIIWIVDGDEIYTEKQLEGIIEFINNNQQFDVYYLQLKNYTFTKNLWIDKYIPQRIFWNNRYGGINEFYFDNCISYNDKTIWEHKPSIVVPKKVAFIDHYSWLNDDSRTVEKIAYQNVRFVGEEGNRCSFIFDGKLKFNKVFHEKRNIQIPILHETLSVHSLDFELSFDRFMNTIYIKSCMENGIYHFDIYDCNSKLIYITTMRLAPGIEYYIMPDSSINFDTQKDFTYLVVRVSKDKVICHEEALHLKYPV